MTELSLCILKLPDGKFVFQRRSKDAPVSPGLIGLFGGHIEAGETADQAMSRELSEETSLDINALTVTSVGKFDMLEDGTRVFLYKSEIEDYSFEVFEGDGLEVYSLEEVLEKDDVTNIVKALLPHST